MIFLVLPSLVLVAIAFTQPTEYGEIAWRFTLENFHRLLGYGVLQWSANTFSSWPAASGSRW